MCVRPHFAHESFSIIIDSGGLDPCFWRAGRCSPHALLHVHRFGGGSFFWIAAFVHVDARLFGVLARRRSWQAQLDGLASRQRIVCSRHSSVPCTRDLNCAYLGGWVLSPLGFAVAGCMCGDSAWDIRALVAAKKEGVTSMTMASNKPESANPALAPRLVGVPLWRRVSAPGRWAKALH